MKVNVECDHKVPSSRPLQKSNDRAPLGGGAVVLVQSLEVLKTSSCHMSPLLVIDCMSLSKSVAGGSSGREGGELHIRGWGGCIHGG